MRIIEGETITSNYKTCEYSECIHMEYDTGYAEYGCCAGDNNPEYNECLGEECCPFNCKYRIELDE